SAAAPAAAAETAATTPPAAGTAAAPVVPAAPHHAAMRSRHGEREDEGQYGRGDTRGERTGDQPGDDAGDTARGERTEHLAEHRAQRATADEREHQQHDEQRFEVLSARGAAYRFGQLLAFDGLHQQERGLAQAAVEIALLKPRVHDVAADAVRDHIGNRALKSAPDFDAGRAILHRQQNEHAVVELLAPDLVVIDH